MNLKVGMKIDDFDKKKWELFQKLSQDVLDGDAESELILADFLEENGVTHWDMGAKENDSMLLKVLKFWAGARAIHMPDGLKKVLELQEQEAEERRKIEDLKVPTCICDTEYWFCCPVPGHPVEDTVDVITVTYSDET